MGKELEFEFECGGRLRFELLEDGELRVLLQAREGWRVTSTSVAIDSEKTEALRIWLQSGDKNELVG